MEVAPDEDGGHSNQAFITDENESESGQDECVEIPLTPEDKVDTARFSTVSIPGIFKFEMPKEENENWDQFTQNEFSAGSASEKHTDLIKKAAVFLKCITIFITTSVVFIGGLLSKALVVFMVAQVQKPTPDERLPSCTPDFEYSFGEKETVPWKWSIFFSFAVPEAMSMLRAIKVLLQKTVHRPMLFDFAVVAVMETIHVSGLAILYFVALPNLDSVRVIMVTTGTCLVPSMLKTLKDLGTSDITLKLDVSTVIIDVIAIIAQIVGLVIWPLATSNNSPNFVWSFVVGIVMTSFGWWEAFVDEHSVDPVSKYLWYLKTSMQENKTRYWVYFWMSIWKTMLFFSFFVGFDVGLYSELPTGDKNRAADLFQDFDFSGRGYQRYNITKGNITDDQVIEIANNEPTKVLLMQLISTLCAYIFGKFACKVRIQLESFALPIMLVGPATLGGVVSLCHYRQVDPCSLEPTIPDHIFYKCPDLPQLMGANGLHGWVCALWFFSIVWIGAHIWRPKSRRLASTDQMFGTPYYCGLMLDTSMILNKRSDRGTTSFRLDLGFGKDMQRENSKGSKRETNGFAKGDQLKQEKGDIEAHNKETLPKWRRMLRVNSGKTEDSWTSTYAFNEEDERTRIMGCATMWHESSEEMIEMIKSIFRIDEDYSARFLARNILAVNDPDFYEWETHIFFDDAFKLEGKHFVVNQFVRLLVEKMDEQGKKWYGRRNMKVPYPIRYATPYGGRLIWTLPGNTKVICHLKDKNKIRHKKRWSQIMYMYYFLGHKLVDNENLTEQQKRARKRNTYLLALDGDVDFQPDAIIKLVDLMKRNPKIGASCGRIHPTGNGFMQSYQMFEYAIGHWLQKSTEHILGCVLCSPGCFSLFRAEAVMDENVMRTYTTLPTEPRHHVQYDQGEDRWLCTLMLQQGWRVEYSAASDSFTACPEGFREFYNQRRRWMPSTFLNSWDLLSDYKRVVRNNDDISIFYIFYQILLMVGTVIGPGSIILMLSGAFSMAFSLTDTMGMLVSLCPVILFVAVCFTCKSDTQLRVAEFLTVAYALIMVAMIVAMAIQIVQNPSSPTAIGIAFFMGIFPLAGILHPQEIKCLPMIVSYFLTIPSMYLLLVIYSVFNLNNVSWGTREVPKTAAELEKERQEAQKETEIKESKKKKRSLFSFFGGISDAGLGNIFSKNQTELDLVKAELKVINVKLDKLDNIETKLNIGKPKEHVPDRNSTKPKVQPKPTMPAIKRNITVRVQEPSIINEEVPRDDLHNPYWIEQQDHIGDGPQRFLKTKELIFWKNMINKYLKPLDKDKDKEKRDAQGLTELRDSSVFTFLMVNSIWVMIFFLLQENKDTLYMTWPIKNRNYKPPTTTTPSPNNYWNQTVMDSNPDHEYPHVEPLGLLVVFVFGLVLFFQLIGMLMHRILTLGHVVSTTNIGILKFLTPWNKNNQFDPDKMLNDEGVKMMKSLQKNMQKDEADDCETFEEVIEKALDNLTEKGNDDALRKFSTKFAGGQRGSEDHMNRTKTVRDALRRRKSVYTARKNTIRYQSQRDKIDEEPDQLEVMPPKSAVSLKLSPLPYRIAEQDNKSYTEGYLGVEQPESDAGSLKLPPCCPRITEERTNSTIDIEDHLCEETSGTPVISLKLASAPFRTPERMSKSNHQKDTLEYDSESESETVKSSPLPARVAVGRTKSKVDPNGKEDNFC